MQEPGAAVAAAGAASEGTVIKVDFVFVLESIPFGRRCAEKN